jgi:hypothetical protein
MNCSIGSVFATNVETGTLFVPRSQLVVDNNARGPSSISKLHTSRNILPHDLVTDDTIEICDSAGASDG